MKLHPDFKDLLAEFGRDAVRYLIVGGYAVAFHGRPRATKDIDLWLAGDAENLARAARALGRFGAPPQIVDLVATLGPADVVYMGSPPVRVDLLRAIDGVDDFEAAWAAGAPIVARPLTPRRPPGPRRQRPARACAPTSPSGAPTDRC